MMEIKLAIFDLDGVLVDSEPVHKRVRGDLLESLSDGKTRTLGFDATGTATVEYYEAFLCRNGLGGTTGKELAFRHYTEVLREIKNTLPHPVGGVNETLNLLRAAGVPCAVTSSSPRFFVEGVLEFYGIPDRFCVVVTADDVLCLKPAPDSYRLTLARASIVPCEAVTAEDSAPGLQAAIAAGIRCVAYEAKKARRQNLAGAWKTIRNMAEYAELILSENG